MTKLTITYIPINLGAQNLGVLKGPNAFKESRISNKLGLAGFAVEERDIEVPERDSLAVGNPKSRYQNEIVKVCETIAKAVKNDIMAGKRPLLIGGDHSLGLGAFTGAVLAKPNAKIGMIYIDAHGDIATSQTTLSGNVHGMHLSALMGYGEEELVDLGAKGRKLDPYNLLHIGACDLDQGEIDLIAAANLDFYYLLDVLKTGIGPIFQKINKLSNDCDYVWVSLDLDSIDKEYAPGVGMPNRQGLTYREVLAICKHIGTLPNVIGSDIVECDPTKDIESKTINLAIELAAAINGKEYNWYTDYMAHQK